MIKKSLIFLLVSYAILAGANAKSEMSANISYSPSKFEVAMDSGQASGTISLQNLTNNTKRITVNVISWALDSEGSVVALESEEDSLDQWMIINPIDVTIEAKAGRSIRWAILPRLKLPDGEYRVMAYLNEIPDQAEGAGINVSYRFGIPIYVTIGEIQRIGVLEDVTTSYKDKLKPLVGLTISSQGNAHVRIRGNYGVWEKALWPGEEAALTEIFDKKNKKLSHEGVFIGSLPKRPILQDTTLTAWFQPEFPIDNSESKESRELILFLSFTLGENTFQKVVPLTVNR
jgi:P pilus assembly chaperone PapD